MREQIKSLAAMNRRSMNSEILARLESTFPPQPETQKGEVTAS
jgi:hypothetical protein